MTRLPSPRAAQVAAEGAKWQRKLEELRERLAAMQARAASDAHQLQALGLQKEAVDSRLQGQFN